MLAQWILLLFDTKWFYSRLCAMDPQSKALCPQGVNHETQIKCLHRREFGRKEGRTFLNSEVREDGGATKEYIYSPMTNSYLCTFKCVRE